MNKFITVSGEHQTNIHINTDNIIYYESMPPNTAKYNSGCRTAIHLKYNKDTITILSTDSHSHIANLINLSSK